MTGLPLLSNETTTSAAITHTAHHKRPVIANVAVARELAGWCWSLAVLDT
ncbi:hypothetical protein [Nocardia sp. NPDC051981]